MPTIDFVFWRRELQDEDEDKIELELWVGKGALPSDRFKNPSPLTIASFPPFHLRSMIRGQHGPRPVYLEGNP
jgi:hypothetical protein